jgi:hypothetical protein
MLICALGPFLLIAIQGYGGEAQLRLFLYTLPFMLILAVGGVAQVSERLGARGAMLLVAVASLAAPALLIAKYGNEQFEQVTTPELTAIKRLYAIAPAGSQIIGLTNYLPLGFRNVGVYSFAPSAAGEAVLSTLPAIVAQARKVQPAYVFVTRSEEYFGESLYRLTPGWVSSLERSFATDRSFRLVYGNPDSRIYEVNFTSPSVPATGRRAPIGPASVGPAVPVPGGKPDHRRRDRATRRPG